VPALVEGPLRRAFVVVAFSFLLSPSLHAQHAAAGASYTLLSLTYPDQTRNGLGGWLTWDAAAGLTVGLDVSASVFPEDDPIVGRQIQLLAGGRSGFRTGRFGAFARVRPGMIHFSERFFAPDTVCILIFPPPESCLIESTNLTVDAGGTVEVYPTSRSVLRLDAGDTLIRFSRAQRDPAWKHNLQFTAGAGVRF